MNTLLEHEITFQQYCKHFNNIKLVTIASKFCDFQYRLLLNLIFTNDRLFKWKKVDSPMCSFCNRVVETMPHLFFHCNTAATLWCQLKVYFDECNISDKMTWSADAILTNLVVRNPSHVVNFIILVAKQYIFRYKCLKQRVVMDDLLNNLEVVQEIET